MNPEERPRSSLEELRELLGGRASSQEIARALREAVRIARERDPDLPEEIRPLVESCLLETVRARPQILVDILFPVILPAIRRSIMTALQSMMEDLNRALESGLTLRSVRYRIEAMRTKRPLAEIILLHSVRFTVLDIFLLHRDTGTLLLHVSSLKEGGLDAAAISSLLPTIQDFIRESLSVPDHRELNRLQIDEYSMWIEQGPKAFIVARTRGWPPKGFHTTLQAIIEAVHREGASELEVFSGDVSQFKRFRTALEEVFLYDSENTPAPPIRNRWGYALVAVSIFGFLVWGMNYSSQRHERRLLTRRLASIPGVVVFDSYRSNGETVVRGLRDPLAPDIRPFVSTIITKPEEVRLDFKPYLSLDPAIIARRARHVDEPSVSDEARFLGLKEQIEGQQIFFELGSTVLTTDGMELFRSLVPLALEIIDLMRIEGRVFEIEVHGSADGETGSPARNVVLSRERAEKVVKLFKERGVAASPVWSVENGKGPLLRGVKLVLHEILPEE